MKYHAHCTLLGLALMAAVGGLSGCQSADAAIQAGGDSAKFARICDAAPGAHLAFVVLAPTVGITQKQIAAEQAAYAVLESVCDAPPENVAQALILAADAYATVSALSARAAEKESG